MVLLLQRIRNFLASSAFKLVIDLSTITIYPKRYDVYMLTGDIIVLEHNVGLLAIAQSLHVLLSYLRERFIGQLLVWMGIERAMEDHFLCSTLFGYQCLHICNYLRHRIFARSVLVQAMCQ